MDILVFIPNAPMYFYWFEGNVGNMTVTRKRCHRQRANMCYFVFYIQSNLDGSNPFETMKICSRQR